MNIEHSKFHNNIEPALRVLAMPKDTNPRGDIFGGWIMSQVDIAGAVVASQLVKSKVVTVAVNEFTFKHPVLGYNKLLWKNCKNWQNFNNCKCRSLRA